jgi:hypothetical protein
MSEFAATVAAPMLTGTVSGAISEEEVLKPNRLAWVTRHFLITYNGERKAHTIIPLSRLAGIEVVKTPYSGLLAIAAGVFIIAAGAFASKQGDGAAVPCALLGAFLIVTYFVSRRANVSFRLDNGATESITGTLGEADALVRLIESARRTLVEEEGESEFSTLSPVSSAIPKAAKPTQPVFEPSGMV